MLYTTVKILNDIVWLRVPIWHDLSFMTMSCVLHKFCSNLMKMSSCFCCIHRGLMDLGNKVLFFGFLEHWTYRLLADPKCLCNLTGITNPFCGKMCENHLHFVDSGSLRLRKRDIILANHRARYKSWTEVKSTCWMARFSQKVHSSH